MRNSSGRNIVLLVQGSYANKTNISNESDVDLAVILESTFITEYRPGISRENYGFTAGTYTALELKDEVERALNNIIKMVSKGMINQLRFMETVIVLMLTLFLHTD